MYCSFVKSLFIGCERRWLIRYKAIAVSDFQEFCKIFAIRCEIRPVGKLTWLKKG